jgi:DNA phosphorothioation-associated putative methyltransferase
MGLEANGWDPIHNSSAQKAEADIVNLGFVLNVIEDQIERTSVLKEAYDLSKKLLVVSSMITNSSTEDTLLYTEQFIRIMLMLLLA